MRAFVHALRLICGYIFRIWIVCWESRCSVVCVSSLVEKGIELWVFNK